MLKIVLGGPGCGKTTYLISEVMQLLKDGVEPSRIGYVAFTRKAAQEATARAQAELGLSDDDLMFFRTLHSLAFRLGGFTPGQLMTNREWDEFATWMNIKIYVNEQTNLIHTEEKGLQAYSLSRLRRVPLSQVCREMNVDEDRAAYYARHLEKYKSAKNMIDYTDMIEQVVQNDMFPQLHTLIVDEAQDLTRLQWEFVHRMGARAENMIVAGDDDQAIYDWAGADVEHFLGLQGEKIVLEKSYRMASNIHKFTQDLITENVVDRFEKKFTYNEEGGNVGRVNSLAELNFDKGSWLVLCRARYQLSWPKKYLRMHGYPFIYNGVSSLDTDPCRALLAWEGLRKGKELYSEEMQLVLNNIDLALCGVDPVDIRLDPERVYTLDDAKELLQLKDTPDWMTAIRMPDSEKEYYRAIKRRGESLIDTPRITLSTIHGVKGGEADSVALFTDMPQTSFETYVKNTASEGRVFYVGASRARENLFIFSPRNDKYFRLPHVA